MIEVDGEPIGGRAAHRHALGLLALLATAPGRSMSRDKLVAYLWPEADATHVRHRLNVALYELRKVLGHQAIVSAGDDLRLDPDEVWVDVIRFEDALEREDHVAAIELHRGPFLDGFHLAEAIEIDGRISAERARLQRAFTLALEFRAREAEREEDLREAVRCWRRMTLVDPYGSKPILGLMRALVAGGERAEALRVAEDHARRVGEELGAPPDPSVETLAGKIRDREDRPMGTVPAEGSESPGALAVRPPWPEEPADAVHPATFGSRGGWRLGVIAAVLGIALLLLVPRFPGGTADEVVPDRLVVLPFTVRGSDEFTYLGDGMAEILGTTLDGVGSLRTVDPHAVLSFVGGNGLDPADPSAGRRAADRFGAGRFVLGSIVESGRRIHVQATLYRRDGTVEGRAASGAAGSEDLFEVVDDLTRRLVAPRFDPGEERLARLAVVTSASLPALKAYLEGETRLRDGEYDAARDAFQLATREDSTFALAWYRLAVAAEWAFVPHEARVAVDRAVRLADRLPERDRLLLTGWRAYSLGQADRAEKLYERILDEWPDAVEAWIQLAEIRFHHAPSRGRTIAASRAAFERVLDLDPTHVGARLHLARIAALQDDAATLDVHVRWLGEHHPESQAAFEARALRAFATGDREAADRLARELEHEDSYTAIGVLIGQFHAEDVAGLEWAAERLTDEGRPVEVRTAGWMAAALVRSAAGRAREAETAIERAESLDPLRGGELRALVATLPLASPDPRALEAAREALERGEAVVDESFFLPDPDGERPAMRLWLRGLIAAGLGRTEMALGFAEDLDATIPPTGDSLHRDLARGIRAEIHRLAGRYDAALKELSAIEDPPGYEMVLPSPFHPRARERFLRARLLEEAGRTEEARRAYEATGNRSLHDLPYRAPIQLRLAGLLERRGDHAAASERYRRFLALSSRADDPERRAQADSARRSLADLAEIIEGESVAASSDGATGGSAGGG